MGGSGYRPFFGSRGVNADMRQVDRGGRHLVENRRPELAPAFRYPSRLLPVWQRLYRTADTQNRFENST